MTSDQIVTRSYRQLAQASGAAPRFRDVLMASLPTRLQAFQQAEIVDIELPRRAPAA